MLVLSLDFLYIVLKEYLQRFNIIDRANISHFVILFSLLRKLYILAIWNFYFESDPILSIVFIDSQTKRELIKHYVLLPFPLFKWIRFCKGTVYRLYVSASTEKKSFQTVW